MPFYAFFPAALKITQRQTKVSPLGGLVQPVGPTRELERRPWDLVAYRPGVKRSTSSARHPLVARQSAMPSPSNNLFVATFAPE
jgi:hypothetical protein